MPTAQLEPVPDVEAEHSGRHEQHDPPRDEIGRRLRWAIVVSAIVNLVLWWQVSGFVRREIVVAPELLKFRLISLAPQKSVRNLVRQPVVRPLARVKQVLVVKQPTKPDVKTTLNHHPIPAQPQVVRPSPSPAQPSKPTGNAPAGPDEPGPTTTATGGHAGAEGSTGGLTSDAKTDGGPPTADSTNISGVGGDGGKSEPPVQGSSKVTINAIEATNSDMIPDIPFDKPPEFDDSRIANVTFTVMVTVDASGRGHFDSVNPETGCYELTEAIKDEVEGIRYKAETVNGVATSERIPLYFTYGSQ